MMKIVGMLLVLLLIISLATTQCEGYVNSTTLLSESIKKQEKRNSDKKPELSTKDMMLYNISDVQYHVDPETLNKDTKVMVKNRWGQLVEMPWSTAVKTTPRYNPTGFFTYGPSNYVPDYTESVLLSRGMRSVEDGNEIDIQYVDIDNKPGLDFIQFHRGYLESESFPPE
jgi:hypothetical protein